ncbi:GDP-mannose pyrophosphorylase [Ordospora colligata]|uniref:mannose-1-phosphate guanylyltransferase n=1 Tax=Ordospora colligata OC4 TaxID=1354746 RepID=A0A0B2UIG8_9MICR|nr:GDP-mannose pyrophosphorylase [Ordospora colligata OC4]KHN68837.1 GDP-mannose pyrophosphorylase [Ordospora colligata OC4]TBU13871.1 GDP-mannose pyrophosphorylase [Ordospora colligata]TBU14060.1 GDP-mannose pyrophosphorylase [Ordospora colligata]TBU17729.1 GDP-mannose pyrophosphorylase [Ordospora colligata]
MVHVEEKTKAVILVGGYGSRLRPLTYTVPKPLVPFANKPILRHQIEALVQAGVKEIILALNYYSELIIQEVRDYSEEFGITITYSKEQDPLGTAGPLALAKRHLDGCTFFVLNSDVICRFPLLEMLAFHHKHGKQGTILSTTVDDPNRYGAIVLEQNTASVKSFLEKPKNSPTNRINAGIYILESSVLDIIELKECSIEREIFPAMAVEKELQVFDLKGFWMDIGQPADYIKAQGLYLKHIQGSDAVEDLRCCISIENNVVIGKNVKMGRNVTIINSTVFDNVEIGDNVIIKDSIIGWCTKIGEDASVVGFSVLGYATMVQKSTTLESVKMPSDTSINSI